MILPVFLPPASFPQLFTEMLLLDVLGSSSLRENHIKELGLGFRTFVLELSSLLFLLVAVSGDGKSPSQCCLCLLWLGCSGQSLRISFLGWSPPLYCWAQHTGGTPLVCSRRGSNQVLIKWRSKMVAHSLDCDHLVFTPTASCLCTPRRGHLLQFQHGTSCFYIHVNPTSRYAVSYSTNSRLFLSSCYYEEVFTS